MESAFIGSSIKTIFTKSTKYLSDMFAMKFFIVGVDEDIVEIDDHVNIEHVREDVVYEFLKSCWRISESKRHDLPFKQSVVGLECSLPFITFSNVG
jgi:hypothetical protein